MQRRFRRPAFAWIAPAVLLGGSVMTACGASGREGSGTTAGSTATVPATTAVSTTTSTVVSSLCAAVSHFAAAAQADQVESGVGQAALELGAMKPELRTDVGVVASAILGQPVAYGPDPAAALQRIRAGVRGECPHEADELAPVLDRARGPICASYRAALRDSGPAAASDGARIRAALAVNADPALVKALGQLGTEDLRTLASARDVVRSYLGPVCGT